MEHQHGNRQFTCPMHPEVVKDAPGKCPKCGMDLVPLSNSKGEHAEHQHHVQHENEHAHHNMKVEKTTGMSINMLIIQAMLTMKE